MELFFLRRAIYNIFQGECNDLFEKIMNIMEIAANFEAVKLG